MKLKRKVVCAWVLLALVMGLVWYNHQYHSYGYPFITTPSGFSYKSIGRQGNGKKVKDGEWVELSLMMKVVPKQVEENKESNPKEVEKDKEGGSKEVEKDKEGDSKEVEKDKEGDSKEVEKDKEGSAKAVKKSKQRSTQERILIDEREPFFLRFDQYFQSKNKHIAEMIAMVEEGQRMLFKSNFVRCLPEENQKDSDEALALMGLSKADEIVVDIKLTKIMTDQAYNEMLAQSRATQFAKDKKLITDYLTAHHIEASSTDSGLYYIIDKASEDMPVAKGKMVKVYYTGRLLDGTIFDTNLEEVAKANNLYHPKRPYEPITFQVGIGQVIKGWDEGLLLLKKHEKARFFIPSALAYGPDKRGNIIPPNAILLFEVEVVDVFDDQKS